MDTSSAANQTGSGPRIYYFTILATELPGSNADHKSNELTPCFIIQDHKTRHSLGVCVMCGTLRDDVVSNLFSGATLEIQKRSDTAFVHGQTKTSNDKSRQLSFNKDG